MSNVETVRIHANILQYLLDTKQLEYAPVPDEYIRGDMFGVAVPNDEVTAREIDFLKTRVLALTTELAALRTTSDVKQLDVFEYVDKDTWDTFSALAIAMLANGATLYELQQRLMGLS